MCRLQKTWSFELATKLQRCMNPKSHSHPASPWTLEICFSCCYKNPACWLICLAASLWCTHALLVVCLAHDLYRSWFLQKGGQAQLQSRELSTTAQLEIQKRDAVGFRKSWEMLCQKHGPNHCSFLCQSPHRAGEEPCPSSYPLFWNRGSRRDG